MDDIADLFRLVSGNWCSEKVKEVWILYSRKSRASFSLRGNLLVPHQRAVEARGTPFGKQVRQCVINGIILVPIIGAMIALEIDGLRVLVQNHTALGILWRLNCGALIRFGM